MGDPEQRKKTGLRMQPHYLQWGLTGFCVIVSSVLVFYLVGALPALWQLFCRFLSIVSPFIYGFVMAYLLLPIFNGLYRRIRPWMELHMRKLARFSKGICSIITLLIGILIVTALLWMVLPQLVVSIFSLMESMDTYLDEISNWVASLLENSPVLRRNFMQLYNQFSEQIINWVQNIALPQLVALMTGVVTTMSVLFDLLVGVIIALYILNSKDTFCAQAKKIMYSLFSISRANGIIRRVAYVHRVFGGFITGKLIDSFIIGILCFIGVSLLKIPYAVLISVIVGVTNIIPFFGPFIGAIPSTILIMVISPVQAVYFVLFIFALQQFDGNILGPKILGDSTGLSSFWVMFAILVFGGFFGFVGMAVGVPLFAVIYSALSEFINYLLQRRGLETNTNAYRGHRQLDPETKEFVLVRETIQPVSRKERRRAAQKTKVTEKTSASDDPPQES